MDKVIVYSVPGSGTRFAQKFLTDVMDYELCMARDFFDSPARVWMHFHTDHDLAPVWRSGPKILSPLRDPYLSHITRNCRDFRPHQKKLLPKVEAIWAAHWERLIATDTRKTIYLPVDTDLDHRALLQHVIRQLGAVKHRTGLYTMIDEWPKVGTFGGNQLKTEYLETGCMLGKKLTFLDFAVDWYNEKVEEIRQCIEH